MATCYTCGWTYPARHFGENSRPKRHEGRHVLICAGCSKATNESNNVIALISIAGMAVLGLIVYVIRVLY